MNVFDELRPAQREAVEATEDDLLILACAGSGKTRTIAARIIYILKTKKNISPKKIVAFTYTDKAAQELKNRIFRYAKAELGSINGLADMFIGTIHSYCLKLLQSIDGYQTFTVLEPIRLRLFIERNFYRTGMKSLGFKRYQVRDFIHLMNKISENPAASESGKVLTIHEKFCNLLLKNKYLGFSLILAKALEFIRGNQEVREELKANLKYLIVDEYQDVNPVQEEIIRELKTLGANLCVVGDDDQTIYGFRGSSPDAILNFCNRYGSVKQIRLNENFRSGAALVALAGNIADKIPGRYKKDMISRAQVTREKNDIIYQEFDCKLKEAAFIAGRAEELAAAGYNYSDIAVLVRKRKIIPEITAALAAKNIPFITDGLNGLFYTEEAIACSHIFNYLNKTTGRNELAGSWKAVHKSLKAKDINNMTASLDGINIKKYGNGRKLNLQRIFYDALSRLNFSEDTDKADKREEIIMYNLGKFSRVINDFETIYYSDSPSEKLQKFCRFLNNAARNSYSEGFVEKAFIKPSAVQIMTVHGAKGLEFPVVFIPRLNEGFFPAGQEDRPEDERRLFYVAATRAQQYLFLTCAADETGSNNKSIFFSEAVSSGQAVQYSAEIGYQSKQSSQAAGPPITLDFKNLGDFFTCPYKFKLTYLYGFTQPLTEPLGYGKSLRDIVFKVCSTDIKNNDYKGAVKKNIKNYFSMPYAPSGVKRAAHKKIYKTVMQYFDRKSKEAPAKKIFESYIEMDLGDNITAADKIGFSEMPDGKGNKILSVYNLISSKVYEDETAAAGRLKAGAAGYKQLTSECPQEISVYNLDNNSENTVKINEKDIEETEIRINIAAKKIRENTFKKCRGKHCSECFHKILCIE